jgi:hypothetical protein
MFLLPQQQTEIINNDNNINQHTIKGQLPFLNNDSAFVRSCCDLSPLIDTAFQPLKTLLNLSLVAITIIPGIYYYKM